MSSTNSSSTVFSVVTANVRLCRTNDGAHNWVNRKPVLLDVLRELDPDILGTQEPYLEQVEAIAEIFPDHQRIGVGRDDGKQAGEWSALFVRKSRFTVQEEGNFWFSETPQVPGSRSWDALYHPRLCTWARLQEHTNGETFYIYNSHWDHQGVVARENSAALLAQYIAGQAEDVPAILTGDFNTTPDSAPVQYLTGQGDLGLVQTHYPESPKLRDTWTALHPDAIYQTTFHGFGKELDGPRIDYILTSPSIIPIRCEIITTNQNGLYPSDHYPVKAVLGLPDKSE